MPEQWKNVPGYEGLYQVSNRGSVRSLDRATNSKWGKKSRRVQGKVLRPHVNKYGYSTVRLYNDHGGKLMTVHRVVMMAFVGPSSEAVNHKDGNKANNHLENLEYCTNADNMRHAADNGLMRRAENHYKSKIVWDDVRDIRRRYAAGESQVSIAREYPVNRASIGHIVRNETWVE